MLKLYDCLFRHPSHALPPNFFQELLTKQDYLKEMKGTNGEMLELRMASRLADQNTEGMLEEIKRFQNFDIQPLSHSTTVIIPKPLCINKEAMLESLL